MGYASYYDVYIRPIEEDAYIFVPMVIWWIVYHIALHHLAPRLIPHFKRFEKKTQEAVVIRLVSATNGILMSTAMPVFYHHVREVGISPFSGLYVQIPSYHFYRVAITAYFMWDLIVCIYYQWEAAWVIHALCSLLGTYFMMYPMVDDLACYFGGWFEGTNAFMHFAVILRTIADVCHVEVEGEKRLRSRANGIATVLEYVFALLFLLVRVIGGSVVTFCCDSGVVLTLWHDYVSRPAGAPLQSHNDVVLVLSFLAVSTIQLLQYYWFVLIVKKGLGLDQPPTPTKEEDAKPKTKKDN